MEWEQMLEEYLAMLESFAGAGLFARQAVGETGEAAGSAAGEGFPAAAAAAAVQAADGQEDASRAAAAAAVEWAADAGVLAADLPEAEAAVRPAVRAAVWAGGEAAEGMFPISGGPSGGAAGGESIPPESRWAGAGRMEAGYAAEAEEILPGAAVYPPEERERVLAALEQAMPEADGMVFRPAGPPGWDGTGRDVFLWQQAAGRRREKAEAPGGRQALFEGVKPEPPIEGREADEMADRLLDALEARLMLEIGSGAEGFYR